MTSPPDRLGAPAAHPDLPAAVTSAGSVDALIRALVASDPGRPRVTWYGADGERVELSGRVLANWVAKTGNLLVEECDVQPGSVVHLDLPPHWRSVVFALAAWSVGASVTGAVTGLPEDAAQQAGEPDVLVTSSPAESGHTAPTVVAVALPALARRFDQPVPEGARWDVDYAAEVSGFADEPLYVLDDDPDRALGVARERHVQPEARLLLVAGRWPGMHAVLAALAADGSVVLVADPQADLEALAESENVTVGGAGA